MSSLCSGDWAQEVKSPHTSSLNPFLLDGWHLIAKGAALW